MRSGIVAQDSEVWQGHPDVAYFNERIYVVWRESDRHLTDGGTSIKVVHGSIFDHEEGDASLSYLTEPESIASSPHRLNCPRLSVIGDSLYMICDEILGGDDFIGTEVREASTRVFLWKTEDGRTWNGPLHTSIRGIVPDRICQFNNAYLMATHTGKTSKQTQFGFMQMDEPEAKVYLAQNIWKTTDLHSGNWVKYSLADDPEMNLCEASVTVTPEGQLLCLMRENSQKGLPAYCTVSENGSQWIKPTPTRLFGCHRPVTGFLKSGRLFTTYREASHIFSKRYWARNTFAHLCDFDALDLNKGIILPLDHDRSEHPDGGYTGWVQLPDERIVVVNYITNDAPYTAKGGPKPYIKWYILTESDFCKQE